jgi:putative hydrolase of the HAD superfamily
VTQLGRFRGLILDFAGVMTTDVLVVHREWCIGQGLEPEAWRRTLNETQEGRRLYADLEVGRLTQADWNRATGRLLGLADSDGLMGRVWAGVEPSEDMVQVARAARAAGLTVALLSNSFGLHPYNPYLELGIWDLFDVHVVSELEGIAKPALAIYRLALERMGLCGEEAVFVDDHERNLPPAAALGITAVLGDGGRATAHRVSELLGLNRAGA